MGVIEYKLDFNPFYVFFKKHYCPQCQNKMTTSYINQIVPRKEATLSSFHIGDITFTGDLETRQLFFWCPKCDFKISITEMRNYEKNNK